jgi:hypothetical protein
MNTMRDAALAAISIRTGKGHDYSAFDVYRIPEEPFTGDPVLNERKIARIEEILSRHEEVMRMAR